MSVLFPKHMFKSITSLYCYYFFSHLSHHHFSSELKFSSELTYLPGTRLSQCSSAQHLLRALYLTECESWNPYREKHSQEHWYLSLSFTLFQLQRVSYCSSKNTQVLISKCSPFLFPLLWIVIHKNSLDSYLFFRYLLCTTVPKL